MDLARANLRRGEAVGQSAPSTSKNFKVAVRVRPLIQRDWEAGEAQCVMVEQEHRAVVINKPAEQRRKSHSQIGIDDYKAFAKPEAAPPQNFFFDIVFGPSSRQEDIYEVTARHIVESVLHGYNGSIIAYGQTGTGKSYTIEGGITEESRGVIPRASEEIFDYIRNKASSRDRFLVRASFLEIYQEKISDLLDTRDNLRIREDGSGSVYVEGLSEHVVKTTDEIKGLIKKGSNLRSTASTRMNKESSRSHAVFTIILEHEQLADSGRVVTIGKLRLVDLAGSERIDMEAQSKRQEETKNINLSLHTFGKVVMALTTSSSSFIPYRDAKLTRILQDSLGGNCKTTLITTVTPVASCYMESLNSLKFAKRAKQVKNNAIINKDVSQKAMLSAYQDEIRKLREQLKKRGSEGSVDPEELQRLEKEKMSAEMEKANVLSQLEKQQRLYSEAQAERDQLMTKIAEMEQKFVIGGSVSESDEFKSAIKKVSVKIRSEQAQEFQMKLAELEQEKKRLATEREEVQRQREYISKMRADFKPDGRQDDSTEEAFRKLSIPGSMSIRPSPPGASRPPSSSQLPSPTSGPAAVRRISARQSLPFPPRRHTWAPTASAAMYHPPSALDYGSPAAQGYPTTVRHALMQYAEALAHPTSGIPCQALQTGQHIFTGTDAVSWFTQNMEGIETTQQAQNVGQRLLGLGIITEIEGGMEFIISDSAYYQFSDLCLTPSPPPPLISRPVSAMSLDPYGMGSRVSLVSLPPGYKAGYAAESMPNVHRHSASLYSSRDMPKPVSQSMASLKQPTTDLLEKHQLSLLSPSPLHTAAISGDRSKVKEIAQHMDVNTTDTAGNTPLMYATLGRQAKCCSLLVKQLRADINTVNTAGQTALMAAVLQDNEDMVKTLLRCDASTDYCDPSGDNVFHLAAKSSNIKVMEYLVKYFTSLRSVNERNDQFHSPLHVAVVSNQPRVIRALLKSKADVGVSDSQGRTPLHYAAMQNNIACTAAIVEMSPNDANLVDVNEASALHLACQEGSLQCVTCILDCPVCDCNLVDDRGNTPLHIAVRVNRPDIVRALLMHGGVDMTIKDRQGRTAVQYCSEHKKSECLRTLQAAAAATNGSRH